MKSFGPYISLIDSGAAGNFQYLRPDTIYVTVVSVWPRNINSPGQEIPKKLSLSLAGCPGATLVALGQPWLL